jgi:hypothetical protein
MYGFTYAYEIIEDKKVKVSGIGYTDSWEVEEDIGIFSFDKIIYQDEDYREFLAIKKSECKEYIFSENLIKLVYLQIGLCDSGLLLWLLAECVDKREIERINFEETIERFRSWKKRYKEEFFGGVRVEDYLWQRMIYYEVVERMNGPNALIVSNEPIRRYFEPLPLIIDIG